MLCRGAAVPQSPPRACLPAAYPAATPVTTPAPQLVGVCMGREEEGQPDDAMMIQEFMEAGDLFKVHCGVWL